MKILKGYLLKIWHDAASHNNEILASYVEHSEKAKALDIGPFRGELISQRVKNIKKPEIYAVDIDNEAINSCRDLGIKAKRYDVNRGLPYKTNEFDIVSANQIIEHLTNTDLFAKEVHRVLKPNGYLVLSTENLSSWHNIFALILGWQAFSQQISTFIKLGNPFKSTLMGDIILKDKHQTIFTPFGLKSLFEFYGFKIEKFFGAGYYPFPATISRILSKIDSSHCAFIGLKARKGNGKTI